MIDWIGRKLWGLVQQSMIGFACALPGNLVHSCTEWVMHGTEYRVQLSATERKAMYRQMIRNTRRLPDIKKNDYIQPGIHPIIILL